MTEIILKVGLQLIGWLIGRSQLSKEQKKAFLEFHENYEKLGNASVKHHDEVEKQLSEFSSVPKKKGED